MSELGKYDPIIIKRILYFLNLEDLFSLNLTCRAMSQTLYKCMSMKNSCFQIFKSGSLEKSKEPFHWHYIFGIRMKDNSYIVDVESHAVQNAVRPCKNVITEVNERLFCSTLSLWLIFLSFTCRRKSSPFQIVKTLSTRIRREAQPWILFPCLKVLQ